MMAIYTSVIQAMGFIFDFFKKTTIMPSGIEPAKVNTKSSMVRNIPLPIVESMVQNDIFYSLSVNSFIIQTSRENFPTRLLSMSAK